MTGHDEEGGERPAKRSRKTGEPAEPDRPFEEALRELEQLAAQMERGDLTLDESIAAFERGLKLSALCRRKLDEAEGKIQKLTREAGLEDWSPESVEGSEA